MAKATYYFSHDFSARNDPKLQMLLRKHGMAGVGAFWCLVELLHEQDGYLMLSQYEDYAFALRSDCDLIKSIVNDFGLFRQDAEKFWSVSALERIKERKAKSVRAQVSANARWNNANALQPHCEGNAIKESKGKKSKGNKDDGAPPPAPTITPSFSHEENRRQAIADEGFTKVYYQWGLQGARLEGWLDAFNRKLAHDGAGFKAVSDYRKHFSEWLKFQPYRTASHEDYSPLKAPTIPNNQPSGTIKSSSRPL